MNGLSETGIAGILFVGLDFGDRNEWTYVETENRHKRFERSYIYMFC